MDQLAVSLAGHDKGKLYAIVREEGNMVFLADGEAKKLDQPKRKNRLHVRRIVHLPDRIADALGQVRQDSDLVYVLRSCKALLNHENVQEEDQE
jgi:hypothetical protein